LSSSEIAVLEKLIELNKVIEVSELAKITGFTEQGISSILELLKSKGIVEVQEHIIAIGKATEEGMNYLDGLPEERVAILVQEMGGEATISIIKNRLGEPIASIGINWAIKRGWVKVDKGIAKFINYKPLSDHRNMLRMFSLWREIGHDIESSSVFQELVKRKLIEVRTVKRRYVRLSISLDEARKIIPQKKVVSKLTHELLTTGEWKSCVLKPFNLDASPPIAYPGKRHFFKEFVELIKDVMEDLGFEEVSDDYVIPELWNFDILFQAQDHPSRDIHDILVVEGYADLSQYSDIVERVRRVHESGGSCGSTGWRYRWSYEKASKLMLRSHTTAVTARRLIGREPPARLYAIARVFRRDNPDPRHSPEFTNFDGVIMERGFTFKKLLGLLSQILKALGIEKFKFKPAYFPFTEPSVEGYGYVPGYGWVEVFGAGMFRPEVLEMLNTKASVGAWGMGVERLAMIVYGINDIRLLFSKDVEFIRTFPYIKRHLIR
jgi:phenylalanyl-tRNA synthetase alpha chain